MELTNQIRVLVAVSRKESIGRVESRHAARGVYKNVVTWSFLLHFGIYSCFSV